MTKDNDDRHETYRIEREIEEIGDIQYHGGLPPTGVFFPKYGGMIKNAKEFYKNMLHETGLELGNIREETINWPARVGKDIAGQTVGYISAEFRLKEGIQGQYDSTNNPLVILGIYVRPSVLGKIF